MMPMSARGVAARMKYLGDGDEGEGAWKLILKGVEGGVPPTSQDSELQ